MILGANDTSIAGNAQMKGFSIEMNHSMFNLLTKNVYTNTVKAVVREWGTNAVDACIDAGVEPKFDVSIPNVLSPEFSVRDYGTGLAPEDIEGLFATLGASTKRDSNKYNGTFGIGRMAGLAYSDSFTVDSYYNGTKYSRLVTAAEGIPQMVVLGDSPTKEPNGLCLTVAVAQKDTTRFKETAEKVYNHFSTKPTTNEPLNYYEFKVSLEGDGWKVLDTNYRDEYYNTLTVVMGNVAYAVDKYTLESGEAKSFAESIGSIVFDVPLGEVAITPGRESLTMDDKTQRYLAERLMVVKKRILSTFHSAVATAKTPYARACAFNQGVGALPWSVSNNVKHECTGNDSKTIASLNNRAGIKQLPEGEFNLAIQLYRHGYVTMKSYQLDSEVSVINAADDVLFMVADLRTGVKEAVAALRATVVGLPPVIILKPYVWDKDKVDEHILNAQEYLDLMGVTEHTLMSDVYTPTVRTSGAAKVAADFLPLDIQNNYSYSTDEVSISRSDTPIKSTDKGPFYYVECSGYEVTSLTTEVLQVCLELNDMHKEQNPNGNAVRIIGIPKKGLKDVKADPRFIPLEPNAIKHLVKDVRVIDYTHSKVLFSGRGGWGNGVSTYNVEEFLKDEEGIIPTDIRDYFTAVHAFEKARPINAARVRISSLGLKTYDYDVLSPATTHPDTWLTDNYYLTMKMLSYSHVYEYKDIRRCAELENFKRIHNGK